MTFKLNYSTERFIERSMLCMTFVSLFDSEAYMSQLSLQSVSLYSVCIYGVCLVFTVYSDFFLKQHRPVDLYNGELWCSL
jgi:hypothetical protein